MPPPSYWERSWRRRLSRRGLLRGGVYLGAGVAAAGILGCSGKKGARTPSPSPGRTLPEGGVAAPEGAIGGTLRLPGFEAFISDTLDPHQTQFGPIYSSHSSVFSKVLRYKDTIAGEITTDLASALPESHDGQEYTIHLRRGVRFHQPSRVLGRKETPQEIAVGGRELTAEDVVYSFQRQVNKSSPRARFYFRAYEYDAIERIEAVDPYTVRIVTREPLALLPHYLADTNAFIIAKELVDADDTMNLQESMIGSGPFLWDHLQPLQESQFARNPDWFGWDDPDLERPYIGAYHSVFLADDAPLEATFREKKIDAALQVSSPLWVRKVREDHPEVQARDVGFAAWINTRFVVDRPPFNDLRLRKAVHLASDRQQMVDVLYQGSGMQQGPISPVLERWALPQEELLALPGYRRGPDRDADIREARQMYEAAGSPPLEVIFADQPAYVAEFASQFQRMLKDTLGAEVKPQIRGYLQIGEGLARGDMKMTWQYDNGWLDPDAWFYPFFHTGGPQNSFRLSDPQLDTMLEQQRREFDFEKRQALVRDIQRYLLDKVLARVDYVTPINLWVAWPYYRNFAPSPFFGESYQLANVWIDNGDPSYKGRAS